MKRTLAAAIVAAGLMTSGVQAQTAANLPSGRDLLLKSLHATGADTVLPKHTSMTMTGTVATQGVSGSIVFHKTSSGQFHAAIDIAEVGGVIEQGYADGTAWLIHPALGPQIITGAGEQSARRQGVWLDGPDQYASLTTVALEKFQGKDAYKVEMVMKDSSKMTRYFDPTSGLTVGTVTKQDTPNGPVEITSVVSDYKNFSGLLFPTKQAQVPGDQEITMTSIEFDNVKPEVVALPASVKALKK
jgi:hypothetical protein